MEKNSSASSSRLVTSINRFRKENYANKDRALIGEEIMQLIMSAPLRKSKYVLEVEQCARDSLSKFTTKFWDIVEWACFSALDLGRFDKFKEYNNMIHKMFPKSWRANRLFGLRKEARGHWLEAAVIYENILYDHPACLPVLKRQVTILKAQGDYVAAIGVLNQIVSCFMQDTNSWIELSNLYIHFGKFSQASFCIYELLLYESSNWAYHLRLAEILYTMGGEQNLLTARSHYCQSLRGNSENNLRALYGLLMTTRLLETLKHGSKPDNINAKLKEYATDMIAKTYENIDGPSKQNLAILELEK